MAYRITRKMCDNVVTEINRMLGRPETQYGKRTDEGGVVQYYQRVGNLYIEKGIGLTVYEVTKGWDYETTGRLGQREVAYGRHPSMLFPVLKGIQQGILLERDGRGGKDE